jgi:hypothetical protein
MALVHFKENFPIVVYLLTLFSLANCANNSFQNSKETVFAKNNFKEVNRGYRSNVNNDKY